MFPFRRTGDQVDDDILFSFCSGWGLGVCELTNNWPSLRVSLEHLRRMVQQVYIVLMIVDLSIHLYVSINVINDILING
jgi:hypothetical protein